MPDLEGVWTPSEKFKFPNLDPVKITENSPPLHKYPSDPPPPTKNSSRSAHNMYNVYMYK